MKRNKLVLLVVSVLCLSLILSACSGGGSGSGDGEGKTTIKVWAMGAEGKKLPELTKKFEKENPGINVDVQAIPWGKAHDKLLTAVASGNGPDVLQMGTTWVAEFAAAGTFLDLSKYMDDYPNFAPDNFFDGAVQTMKYKDQVIGIPWYVDTRVLFYRSDLLAEVGYEEAPKTWEEFKDAAKKLAARGEGKYGVSIDQKSQFFTFMLAWQNGWTFKAENGKANFDDPKFVEAIKLEHSFFEKGLTPTGESMDIMQAFKKGTLPMFFSGPWMVSTIQDQLPNLKGKWNVAVLPKKKTNTSMIGGSHLSIFANSEHVEESLKFISFMTDVKTQVEWFKISNTLPSRMKAWEDPALKDNEMLKVFGKQLEHTQAAPQIRAWESIAQELLHTLEKINVGNANIDKALAEFRSEVQDILSE